MYRQYENAQELEKELKSIKHYMQANVLDYDERYEAYLYMQELEERINFAYQDEQY